MEGRFGKGFLDAYTGYYKRKKGDFVFAISQWVTISSSIYQKDTTVEKETIWWEFTLLTL